jgi:cellulose synthase/poly-beta-1,6-N-acetylglucosamine synthase-like glycosyltransferase
MATGLAFHSSRNSQTGRRWTSIYTPDVVSVGEGPSSWSDYFNQQMRWSRGTFEVVLLDFWRCAHRLRPRQLLHYSLILTFYPSMALGWILGAVNALLFLGLGATGIHVSPTLCAMLYVDATAFCLFLYGRARRHNVSPHERIGSFGLIGMLMSILAAPVFAASLINAVLRRPARFVVTPKGASASPDRLVTFRRHLQWSALLGTGLVVAMAVRHTATLQTCLWPIIALVISILPVALWKTQREGRRSRPDVQMASSSMQSTTSDMADIAQAGRK